jgi:aminoglycoside phosphotransferase (APT) family kinase protein
MTDLTTHPKTDPETRSTKHAKMHADEVETDASLVRRLIDAQFPEWTGLPVRRVASSGTDNALYRLGTTMLVRMPRIHWAAGDVRKEQRWLPKLAPHLPFEIPAPLAMGEPGEAYPWSWSVYRWIDGDTPGTGALADPLGLARDVAAFVAALQGIDVAGAPHAGRGVDLVQRDAQTRRAIAQLRGQLDVEAVTEAWSDGLAAAPWRRPPVWLHGDLKPDNLLCRGGRLHAVIDFGGLGVGDPAADMLVAWALLPAAARETYRAALDIDAETWVRGRAWALSIALIQLPYYRTVNPELAASARHVIAEVLGDVRAGR